MANPDDTITLKLTGSEAQHGLPWANLASFVDDIRRALREYDRQRQGSVPARGGHPSGREELVTSFRLVTFKPGSAIMELEPIPSALPDDQPVIAEAEQLAVENLRSFVDSLESSEATLDTVITEAIDDARRRLGDDGRIEIRIGPPRKPRRKTVIDAERIARIEARSARTRTPLPLTVSGRLHMLDVEPHRLAIRAGDGVDWICAYPPEKEEEVAALVRHRVAARGIGVKLSPTRGRLEISDIKAMQRPVATPLFSFDPAPLEELAAEQGITRPQGGVGQLLPDDVSDDDIEAFADALLEL